MLYISAIGQKKNRQKKKGGGSLSDMRKCLCSYIYIAGTLLNRKGGGKGRSSRELLPLCCKTAYLAMSIFS